MVIFSLNEETLKKVQCQVEFYFIDSNLSGDRFLMRSNPPDGRKNISRVWKLSNPEEVTEQLDIRKNDASPLEYDVKRKGKSKRKEENCEGKHSHSGENGFLVRLPNKAPTDGVTYESYALIVQFGYS